MNEDDKVFARRALQEKRLTIEQVEEIRREVERSGRSFKDVAASRVPPKAPTASPIPADPAPRKRTIPLPYEILIVVTLLIVLGVPVSVWRIIQTSKKDVELALESEKSIVDSDRKAAEARVGYQRSIIEARETRAKEALAKARDAMARVDARMRTTATSPEITLALNEAFVGYNAYLDVLPDDADVRIERARTHTLRRNYDLAIADLERSADLKPERAQALKDQAAQLRLLLARNPK
jgi:hypothetical protein